MVNFVVKNKLANYKFLPSKNKTSGESNLQLEKLEIQIWRNHVYHHKQEADLGERTTSFANPRHRGVSIARKRMDLYSSVHQYVINGEMGMEEST